MIRTSLGDWPRERSLSSPNDIAVVDARTSRTFAEFDDRVTQGVRALASIGIGRGDRVAYLGLNTVELVEVFFATCALGAVFVPLNYRLSVGELSYILADAQVSVLVRDNQLSDPTEDDDRLTGVSVITVGSLESMRGSYEHFLASASVAEADVVRPSGRELYDDPCLIQYTSGTTGAPKGVVLTHANVIWNCLNIIIENDLTCQDTTLVTSPLIHTSALNATFLPTFLKSGTSVMHKQFDPVEVLASIEEHGVTFMSGVPAMFQSIRNCANWATADLSTLRVIVCAGAPAAPILIQAYQDRGVSFVQGYGMTEAAPAVTMMRAADARRKAGSSGRACMFTEVRIVDAAGSAVPEGVIGEIQVRGPNVTPGYWNNPEATSSAFTSDGWFKTGDAGVVDGDGYVSVIDRYKDMFISGGENVYPAEVERALLEHPAVAECAVVSTGDVRWGEVGRAFVVRHAGLTVSMSDLAAFLEPRLARYKHPKYLHFVDSMPTNASGKVLKKALSDSVTEVDMNGGQDGDDHRRTR